MIQVVTPMFTGVVGLFFGTLIGYYKSRSELGEQLNKMLPKADCAECDLRAVVVEVKTELDKGEASFRDLRADIAGVRQEIAVLAGVIRDRDARFR